MSERAEQLLGTADGQIAELIVSTSTSAPGGTESLSPPKIDCSA